MNYRVIPQWGKHYICAHCIYVTSMDPLGESRMKDKRHTLTASSCKTCEELEKKGLPKPVFGEFYPQASLNHIVKAPVHNWYSFTLGYSPLFVKYVIKKNGISREDVVLDPFVGSGTTLVESKLNGIDSFGVDANDFLVFASQVKTNWAVHIESVRTEYRRILKAAEPVISTTINSTEPMMTGYFRKGEERELPKLASARKLMKSTYISDRPLAKLLVLKGCVSRIEDKETRDLFRLALASIMVPSSNVRFGPGFGVIKPKTDVNVLKLFREKIERMIQDLEYVKKLENQGQSNTVRGDTRKLATYTDGKIFDYVITSPPYPGDHEYTRHTRLELAFLDFAGDMTEVRTIKKRMLRGSTRNVYVGDNETESILRFPEIVDLTNKIALRVLETKGTSGFEKLYSKVVGEYFGGMFLCLQQIFDCLEKGGTASFLVGDSHAFKMVHIETARLLGEIGKSIGFSTCEIELWWNKRSTAHNFFLPEYILHLKR